MASFTIQKRVKKSGDVRYACYVRVIEKRKQVYSETRTFTKQASAKAWGKKRVLEIEEGGFESSGDQVTLGELIQKYLAEDNLKYGRTKRKVLEMVADCNISKIPASDLKAHHLVEHCKDRKSGGTSPATIIQDVSYIKAVLKAAKPMWGYDVDELAVTEAMPTLHQMNLVGKGEQRSRRPTADELERLKVGLKAREDDYHSEIPFNDILDFSILSCMRISEVCGILWEDVDEDQKAVKVRDRKDPRKKAGNHMLVPLIGGAWELLQRQPRSDERIFPYNSRSVTAGFQRVRNALGIHDLRYHDLRREGASRLFEKGYSVDEVAQVTGHRDLNTLWKIYTELYPKRLHDKELDQKQ